MFTNLQATFSNVFPWMETFAFSFHFFQFAKIISWGPINNKPPLLLVMACDRRQRQRQVPTMTFHRCVYASPFFHEFITVTPQWTLWGLKSHASLLFAQPYVQVHSKENIKTPPHKGPVTPENVSSRWRHHVSCFADTPSHWVLSTFTKRPRPSMNVSW